MLPALGLLHMAHRNTQPVHSWKAILGGSELGQNKLNFPQAQVGCCLTSRVICMLPFSSPPVAVQASNTQSRGSLQHFWSTAVFRSPWAPKQLDHFCPCCRKQKQWQERGITVGHGKFSAQATSVSGGFEQIKNHGMLEGKAHRHGRGYCH